MLGYLDGGEDVFLVAASSRRKAAVVTKALTHFQKR